MTLRLVSIIIVIEIEKCWILVLLLLLTSGLQALGFLLQIIYFSTLFLSASLDQCLSNYIDRIVIFTKYFNVVMLRQ